jgi:hypothetical protein
MKKLVDGALRLMSGLPGLRAVPTSIMQTMATKFLESKFEDSRAMFSAPENRGSVRRAASELLLMDEARKHVSEALETRIREGLNLDTPDETVLRAAYVHQRFASRSMLANPAAIPGGLQGETISRPALSSANVVSDLLAGFGTSPDILVVPREMLIPEATADFDTHDDRYPVADWRMEVARGNTELGYDEWVDACYENDAAEVEGLE